MGCCSAVASQSGFAGDLIGTCKRDPIPVIYRVIMTKNKHIRGLFVQKASVGKLASTNEFGSSLQPRYLVAICATDYI